MHHAPTRGVYVDVYQCSDAALAERAVKLLHRAGVEAANRAVGSDLFPTSAGLDNTHVIAVEQSRLDTARRCLQAAADDGVIPGDAIL